MAGDLNIRGVKRKLSAEIDCDLVDASVLENECRRVQSDSQDVLYYSAPGEKAPFLEEAHYAPVNGPKTSSPSSSPNSSMSSQSISDEDGEDEDGSEEDDDDDESEYVDDESLSDPMADESRGQASGESESGYDERASSNSSLSDSATSESDFSPIMVHAEAPIISRNSFAIGAPLVASPASPSLSPSFTPITPVATRISPSSAALTLSSNPPSLGEGVSSSFCAYSNPSPAVNRSSTPTRGPFSNLHNSHYLRQRQQIFNLSLCKLSRFRQSSDPSILRSVLICNTLRMLEKEFEKEGFKINFGPNGVSFISPVASPSDVDFMPAYQATPSTSSFDCAPVPEPIPYSANGPVGPLTSSPPISQSYAYAAPCEPNNDGCSDYDKYFAMDGSSTPSGRVTPFMKNYPSEPYSSTRSGESPLNSAFTYGDEQVSDRLTNLNWSNMLTFNNSPTASPSAPSEPASLPSSLRHHGAPPSVTVRGPLPGNDSLLPYPEESSEMPMLSSGESAPILASSSSSSSCASLSPSPSSATFATLLPSTSTPSSAVVSAPLGDSPELLVSSAASILPDASYSMLTASTVASPHYFSGSSPTSSPLSPYSTSPNALTPTGGTTVASSPVSPSMMTSSYMPSYLSGYSSGTSTDEIFGDIDLSLYDFDIFSPLSPPSVSNKTGPIMSAEELIRNMSASEGNTTSSTTTASSLLSLGHYSVNGFSGQTYTSSSYCTSSSAAMTSVVSSMSTSSAISSMQSSGAPSNCGSSSAASNALHLHTASGRYYKTPEERDQQTVATIKCHN